MKSRLTTPVEFTELRPRLKALLELHRTADTDEARATLVDLFEDVFLATAWHVATDLLENGWEPGFASHPRPVSHGHLRLVKGDDAA
jgi:hypothetical protein